MNLFLAKAHASCRLMHRAFDELKQRLSIQGYVAEDELVTTLLMMETLSRPLLIEGEAGVGKTEIAKALAAVHDCELIRLQCYEGLDTNAAVYEWNYSRQLLSIKLHEELNQSAEAAEIAIFSERFLLERPLLKAIKQAQRPVLLIDEVDRADEAFEAFLLELLSDFQITIPELGTIRAKTVPLVVLTSNATRELSDALRRRCLYHYLDYPDPEKELQILRSKIPAIDTGLAGQIVTFVQSLRSRALRKRPGIAETLDWATALLGVIAHPKQLTAEEIHRTRACLLKTQDDQQYLGMNIIRSLLQNSR